MAYDGNIYQANLLNYFSNRIEYPLDLVFLYFVSQVDYLVPPFGSINKNEKVASGGFPVIGGNDLNGFNCIESILSTQLTTPMEDGYQIGHTADIIIGMSGGPLINSRNELIGVNGMGKPAFINPEVYRYPNGSLVNEQPLDVLASLSWSIPVDIISDLATEAILTSWEAEISNDILRSQIDINSDNLANNSNPSVS